MYFEIRNNLLIQPISDAHKIEIMEMIIKLLIVKRQFTMISSKGLELWISTNECRVVSVWTVFNSAMACASIVNDSMDAYYNHKLFGDKESRL